MGDDWRIRPYYPVSLNIRGKKCVVIGGGKVALRKVKALLENGAEVQVISLSLCPELSELGRTKAIKVLLKEYEPTDIRDVFLVIAATDKNSTNQKVATEARRQKILVNVVDTPEQSDFIVPSGLRRGNLTIAVSTNGVSPALARKVRTRLEQSFGEEYTSLTSLIKEVRSELKEKGITISDDGWQRALDLDLLLGLLQNGQWEKAKATLLGSLQTEQN